MSRLIARVALRVCSVLVILSCSSFASPAAEAAKIQKWTDADGKVHYGSAPPQGASLQRLDGAVSISGSSANLGPEVILYSTAWCGYCRKARSYMRRNGIAFTEYDIEKDPLANADYQRRGGAGVPFLVQGDNVLRGYRESSYRRFFAQ